MATQSAKTTFASEENRLSRTPYKYVNVPVAAAAGTVGVAAPVSGKLVKAFLSTGAAHTTNGYDTMLLANKSKSDAAMFGTNNTTGTAAYAKYSVVLGATAALAVSEGDFLLLTTTADVAPAAASVLVLVFEG